MIDSSWRIHTKLSYFKFISGEAWSTDGETTATLKLKFYALLTVYMYSPNFEIWRELVFTSAY